MASVQVSNIWDIFSYLLIFHIFNSKSINFVQLSFVAMLAQLQKRDLWAHFNSYSRANLMKKKKYVPETRILRMCLTREGLGGSLER